MLSANLDHLLDELVYLVALLSAGAILVVVVEHFSVESASRRRELDGPKEVRSGLEVRAAGDDLMDDILNAVDAELAEAGLNDGVVADGDSLARYLTETALVDKLLNGLKVRIAVSDERLYESEHLGGGSVHANENTVVDLTKAKKLKDLLHLGRDTNDTAKADNENDLLLRSDIDLIVGLGVSSVVNGGLSELSTRASNLFIPESMKSKTKLVAQTKFKTSI